MPAGMFSISNEERHFPVGKHRLPVWEGHLRVGEPSLRVPEVRLRVPEARLRAPEARLRAPEAVLRVGEARLRVGEVRLRVPEVSLRVGEARLRVPEASLRVPAVRLRVREARLRVVEASLPVVEGHLRRNPAILAGKRGLTAGQGTFQPRKDRSPEPNVRLAPRKAGWAGSATGVNNGRFAVVGGRQSYGECRAMGGPTKKAALPVCSETGRAASLGG